MKKHYDICVVGFWSGANYGSLLNGYATYLILKKRFKKKVLMLQKPLLIPDDPEITKGHNTDFVSQYYDKEDISPSLPYSELSSLNNLCDCFCAGSDQIWNYHLSFHENMFLPFVSSDKKLISFATSFGHKPDKTPINARPRIMKYLQRFDAISVREQFCVEIMKDNYCIDAELVFEPVFCIDKKVYYEIAEKSSFDISEPYLLAYILDPTPAKKEVLQWYSESLNIKCVVFLDGSPKRETLNKEIINLPNMYTNIPTEDFLQSFINAKYVITDSFHGSAFSIIFNKPFFAVGNHGRGYDRFLDLFGRLDLMDRLVTNPNDIPKDLKLLDPIDYTHTNEIIKSETKKTIKWLKNAIETPKDELSSQIIPDILPKEVQRLNDNPDFKKIKIIATLLRDYGIKHIVLSPGGRNVPLVRMFEYNSDTFTLHRVTDERSAAYYGLGIAAQSNTPVACICTSGTAVSNYLPAVTEAYFTGVPLIMITADRKQVYHDQGEDQTIPQDSVFNNVTKMHITIPEDATFKAYYQTRRDVSNCILESTYKGKGPVHINIAIENISQGANVAPLYWKIGNKIYPHLLRTSSDTVINDLQMWLTQLKRSNRILIVYGQNAPLSEDQLSAVESFATKFNCVFITDHLSNLKCKYSIDSYNLLNSITQAEFNETLSPDILITVGGKRLMNDPLTSKVRNGSFSIRHWSIAPDGKMKDFYFRLSSILEMSQDFFFKWFSSNAGNIKNNEDYYKNWVGIKKSVIIPEALKFNSQYIQQKFLPKIPSNSLLHLGVGESFYTCRKYNIDSAVEIFCNMGTNGIDGCTSTFMGQCAVAGDRLCFILVGDLSFFYDMNSIWNKSLSSNMRILLVNNNGTGLLRPHNLKGISSVHNTTAKGWVESTGFKYMTANSKEEFDKLLPTFLSKESESPLFFEVLCE